MEEEKIELNNEYDVTWNGENCTARSCNVVLAEPPLLRGVIRPAICISQPGKEVVYLDNFGDAAQFWINSPMIQDILEPPQQLSILEEIRG